MVECSAFLEEWYSELFFDFHLAVDQSSRPEAMIDYFDGESRQGMYSVCTVVVSNYVNSSTQ